MQVLACPEIYIDEFGTPICPDGWTYITPLYSLSSDALMQLHTWGISMFVLAFAVRILVKTLSVNAQRGEE